jgi:iron complex outermembrane receptor protein
VLGLRYQLAPGLNLHAALSRGFESPTLGELAYRRDGSGGFNTELLAQKSRQVEVGVKWRGGGAQGIAVDATLFEVRVADEIGVATNAGGRSAFQNVGATLRKGAELAARWRPVPALGFTLAATALDATYRDNFRVCAGIPCNAPTVPVPAGNRIAGTSKGSVFAEAAWRTPGFGELALEVRQQGNIVVNDRNSEAAAGVTLAGLRWQYRLAVGAGWQAELLVRVDNLGDKRYAGSVIVNDANGRFYETGAPRAWLVALRLGGG